MSPSLTLPANLIVRAPTRDELDAIHALIYLSDLDVFGRPDYTMQELRHDWSRQGFDPAVDAWVVALPDGQLVASGRAHDQIGGQSQRRGHTKLLLSLAIKG